MYLEAIALSLIKALSSFIFSKMLVYSDINIQGAPSWYQNQESAYICVSTFQQGGLESVDIAKNKSKRLLTDKINEIMEIVVYDNFRKLDNESEKTFIKTFLKDDDLPIFVNKTTEYRNIEYVKKYHTTFIRACIDKKALLDYEKERIELIRKKLTHKRADEAFEELETSPAK